MINFIFNKKNYPYLYFVFFFCSAYLRPVFSGNQVMYYFHGLNYLGAGQIVNDSHFNTSDPTPIFLFLIFLLNILFGEYIFLVMYAILSGFYFIFLRKVLYQTFSSLNQIQKNIIDFFIILFYSIYFSGYVLDRNYLDDFISLKIGVLK